MSKFKYKFPRIELKSFNDVENSIINKELSEYVNAQVRNFELSNATNDGVTDPVQPYESPKLSLSKLTDEENKQFSNLLQSSLNGNLANNPAGALGIIGVTSGVALGAIIGWALGSGVPDDIRVGDIDSDSHL